METSPDRADARRVFSTWRDALAVLTAVVIFLIAVGHMFFVVPTYRRLLEGLNVIPSAPAGLAIAASHAGVGLVLLCPATVVVGYWLGRRRRSGLGAAILGVWGLLAAVYLALATWVYLDVARIMQRVG